MNNPVKMAEEMQSSSRILVAAEGGLGLRSVARYAMLLGAPGASLKLVAITGNPRTLFPWIALSQTEWNDAHQSVVASSCMAINKAAQQLRGRSGFAEPQVLDLSERHVTAAVAVGDLARQWQANLIAITGFSRDSHGGGAWRLDPEELAAVVSCPVLHVPFACLEDGGLSLSKVMVAIDGSESAMEALRLAIARLPLEARLHVVYVVDHALGLRYADRIQASMKEGVDVLARASELLEQHAREGETSLIGTSAHAPSVSEAILHEADRWGAHLVVMGSRGRGALTRWLLGTVAERILRHSTRPVLVCPPSRAAVNGTESGAGMRETLAAEMNEAMESGAILPPIFL